MGQPLPHATPWHLAIGCEGERQIVGVNGYVIATMYSSKNEDHQLDNAAAIVSVPEMYTAIRAMIHIAENFHLEEYKEDTLRLIAEIGCNILNKTGLYFPSGKENP